jgi:hypothetical protein
MSETTLSLQDAQETLTRGVVKQPAVDWQISMKVKVNANTTFHSSLQCAQSDVSRYRQCVHRRASNFTSNIENVSGTVPGNTSGNRFVILGGKLVF